MKIWLITVGIFLIILLAQALAISITVRKLKKQKAICEIQEAQIAEMDNITDKLSKEIEINVKRATELEKKINAIFAGNVNPDDVLPKPKGK